ncbi:MAG: biopolymer transporter ExbD [Candidatus Tectomicrobia bacterium]|jgi:biopolymer transport protein ExbD|nr:biopolymer transporter ExbD [Candidatus Tectomicrobia bacterium]
MRFLKKSEEDYSINLPSMTDIIFLLLIFFMVATVLKDSTRRLDVQLPEARSGQTAEAQRLTIEMAADGTMSLNGELIAQEELEQQLRPAGDDAQRSVIIKADKRLSYGKVIEIMGLCQAAGIADIAVAVK